jgi:predicted ATP-dependent serine protease
MTIQRIDEIAAQNIELWKRQMEHPEEYRPIKTNLRDLDRRIGGILDNAYYVIGGPHKSAKTTFAMHLAMVLGTHGRTDYFQLEEIKASMGTRALVHGTKLADRTMIRDLSLYEPQFKDLEQSQKMLRSTDLWIEDAVNTADQIIAKANEDDARFTIIDYLQLMTDNSRQINESTRLESISRKFIAGRNAAANAGKKRTFIVVYQMNEQGKAHGSRTVYKDCDGALEIVPTVDHVRKEEVEGSIDIHILPGRVWVGGQTITLAFNGAHSLIKDMPILDLSVIWTNKEDEARLI